MKHKSTGIIVVKEIIDAIGLHESGISKREFREKKKEKKMQLGNVVS